MSSRPHFNKNAGDFSLRASNNIEGRAEVCYICRKPITVADYEHLNVGTVIKNGRPVTVHRRVCPI